MKKKVFRVCMCMAMVMVLLFESTSVFAQTSTKEKVDLTIKTERQLRNCLNDIAKGNSYSGKLIKVSKDIAVDPYSGDPWLLLSVGNDKNIFAGTFDGAGHTISGIHTSSVTDSTMQKAGLFGVIAKKGTVKNLILADCSFISKKNSFGMLAGDNYGQIVNCRVKGCKIVNNEWASGIVVSNYGTVQDCMADVAIEFNTYNASGIANFNEGKIINTSFGGSFKDYPATGNYYTELCAVDIAAYNNGIIQNCFGYGQASLTNAKSVHYTLCSYIDENKACLRNCYYSEETGDGGYRTFGGVIDHVDALSLEEMRSESFVKNLNRTKGNALAWTLDTEQEYPVHVDVHEVTFKTFDNKKGYVKSSKSFASKGDTVKLTTYLKKPYQVKKLAVKTVSGKTVAVKKGKNGTYTFQMPDENVYVTITAKK